MSDIAENTATAEILSAKPDGINIVSAYNDAAPANETLRELSPGDVSGRIKTSFAAAYTKKGSTWNIFPAVEAEGITETERKEAVKELQSGDYGLVFFK